jgi:hypothetical protein
MISVMVCSFPYQDDRLQSVHFHLYGEERDFPPGIYRIRIDSGERKDILAANHPASVVNPG